jgi:hypothetical protein
MDTSVDMDMVLDMDRDTEIDTRDDWGMDVGTLLHLIWKSWEHWKR